MREYNGIKNTPVFLSDFLILLLVFELTLNKESRTVCRVKQFEIVLAGFFKILLVQDFDLTDFLSSAQLFGAQRRLLSTSFDIKFCIVAFLEEMSWCEAHQVIYFILAQIFKVQQLFTLFGNYFFIIDLQVLIF